MQNQATNKRNENGVKNSSDQYRIIGGERFVCVFFGNGCSVTEAKKYKASGAKVRRIGDDVYVRSSDLV